MSKKEEADKVADVFLKSLHDLGLISTTFNKETNEQVLNITEMGDKVRQTLNWLAGIEEENK